MNPILTWFRDTFSEVSDWLSDTAAKFVKFSKWIVLLLVSLIGLFTDVLTWLLSMLGKLIDSLDYIINFHWSVINPTGSMSTAFSVVDRFVPLHETLLMLETYTLLFIAVITIRVIRFIKKTFWAS